MIKSLELANPESCLNRARFHEMLFVLLGRDVAGPHAIREWAKKRIELGKNKPSDAQIIEALDCAAYMERTQHESTTL